MLLNHASRKSPHRMRLRGLFVVIALVTIALVVCSCGSGSSSAADSSTYTDSQFGFSFDYPSDWQIDATGADPSSGVSASVGAFDPFGSGVDEVGYDQMVVDIYEIPEGESFTLDDVEAELQSWLDYAEGVEETFEVVEPVTATTVGGLQGYMATMVYTDTGIEMRSTEYWLLGDGIVYNLYTDSSEDNWSDNQDAMQKFIGSFKP